MSGRPSIEKVAKLSFSFQLQLVIWSTEKCIYRQTNKDHDYFASSHSDFTRRRPRRNVIDFLI